MRILMTYLISMLVMLPALAGCLDDDDKYTDADLAGPANDLSVDIIGSGFTPSNADIQVGSTVTWTNSDSATHTATADGGEFDSGNLNNGDTYAYTFNTAGTYAYHCGIHSSMTGTITVHAN